MNQELRKIKFVFDAASTAKVNETATLRFERIG